MDLVGRFLRLSPPRASSRQGRVSLATILAYVNMKTSLIYCDLAVGVAVPMYTEVLGMNIGALALIRAFAKSIDFLVAFVIGFASDQCTRTNFLGRRLPFILFGSLAAPLSMYFLAAPPAELNLNAAVDATRRMLLEGPARALYAALPSTTADAGYLPSYNARTSRQF